MNRDTKVFLNNVFHLTFLRGISRVTPLIYTPFLISKLGMANVGSIEFAKALSFYFTAFISYGFRYSATKQISLHKNQRTFVGQIVSSVYTLKLIGIFMSFLVILGLIWTVPSIRQDQIYLLSFFPVVIASTLFPTFVFQALEKMQWLTTLNLVSKLMFIVSIFTLIRTPADTILLPILLGAVDLFRLAIAIYLVYNKLGVAFCWPNRAIMVGQLKEGVHIFFPELATMFYARLPAIFLRLFVGPSAVGIYSLGDRLIRTTTSMIDPFMQALYPVAYKKLVMDKQSGIHFISRVALISLTSLGALGVFYWYFADSIIEVLSGKAMPEGVSILKLHAFLPCIIILSNIVGIGVLLPLKAGNKYTLSMLMAGLVCVGLHFWLVPTLQVQGAAWSILIAESFATVMMVFWAYRELSR
jgi:PST family polysaccharide transporter